MRLEQVKTEAAASAVDSAISVSEKRMAIEAKSMIQKYGTSCILQLFDDEPSPKSSVNRLQQSREERIARAATKRSQFKLELSHLVAAKNHDHTYCSEIPATTNKIEMYHHQNI